MAERRMVAKSITGSDSFLSLGFEARALYLHLIAEADDDGFIANPKKQMRIVGTGEGALSELCESGFVHLFETGVCVVLHWCIHNRVRRDRYKRTVYLREYSQLKFCPDGVYILAANFANCEQNDILQENFTENYQNSADFGAKNEFLTEISPDFEAQNMNKSQNLNTAESRAESANLEANFANREQNDILQEDFTENYQNSADFGAKNEFLTEISPDFEAQNMNKSQNLNTAESRAKIIEACVKMDKESLKTRLPFPIHKEYDPRWCLDYAELFSEESERKSYRELIGFIEDYFAERGYLSSWTNFVKYNEARCWRGVGGENVMARVCHYADEWEKRERLRRGMTVLPEDFKESGEKTFDEYY